MSCLAVDSLKWAWGGNVGDFKEANTILLGEDAWRALFIVGVWYEALFEDTFSFGFTKSLINLSGESFLKKLFNEAEALKCEAVRIWLWGFSRGGLVVIKGGPV